MSRLFTTLNLLTIILVFIALISVYFFPWPFSIFLALIASLFFPPTALLTGALLDLLYYTAHPSGLPLFTILGLLISTIAYFVHQFLKTRIMS